MMVSVPMMMVVSAPPKSFHWVEHSLVFTSVLLSPGRLGIHRGSTICEWFFKKEFYSDCLGSFPFPFHSSTNSGKFDSNFMVVLWAKSQILKLFILELLKVDFLFSQCVRTLSRKALNNNGISWQMFWSRNKQELWKVWELMDSFYNFVKGPIWLLFTVGGISEDVIIITI